MIPQEFNISEPPDRATMVFVAPAARWQFCGHRNCCRNAGEMPALRKIRRVAHQASIRKVSSDFYNFILISMAQ